MNPPSDVAACSPTSPTRSPIDSSHHDGSTSHGKPTPASPSQPATPPSPTPTPPTVDSRPPTPHSSPTESSISSHVTSRPDNTSPSPRPPPRPPDASTRTIPASRPSHGPAAVLAAGNRVRARGPRRHPPQRPDDHHRPATDRRATARPGQPLRSPATLRRAPRARVGQAPRRLPPPTRRAGMGRHRLRQPGRHCRRRHRRPRAHHQPRPRLRRRDPRPTHELRHRRRPCIG